ncbi:MAG: M48 family metallopeptidase [Rhodospirillales bacterium]|nr:M48 family metallopeptidase [Rhodospirillales bacterium]MDE2198999.1 M48 family metallopeptidase [Rhodospirillales bacterium]
MNMESTDSEILRLPGGPARVEWRRNARARRVSLRIDPREGAVVVTLPPRAGRSAGMALLMNHADWVAERLAALPGHSPFADGVTIPLHGVEHRIRHVGGRGGVRAEGRELLVGGEPVFLPRRVADFLRAEARTRFSTLVGQKAGQAELRASRVTVKDTHSRWGSCAANRVLSFSWRLVMAPRFVQDYVAAHEVAHLRHMNHGARFWALVETLTPHTDAAVLWLRREGPKLLRIG